MTPIARRLLLAGALVALLGGFSLEALFAPSPEPWERWARHGPENGAAIDHGAWDRLLARYTRRGPDGIVRFAYSRVTAADRAALDRYIEGLAALPITGYARDRQFPYWVNLYNALTVRLILAHPGVESIRDIDISPGLFADGPWDAELVAVEGIELTLNDIEHRILRPLFRDERVHYAVNCASLGCPDLQPEAFTAANAETLLERGARAYVNHPRGVRVRADGTLRTSSLYVWFGDDFGGEDGVLRHLRRYAGPGLRAKLEGIGAIADHGYDWSLNEAPP